MTNLPIHWHSQGDPGAADRRIVCSFNHDMAFMSGIDRKTATAVIGADRRDAMEAELRQTGLPQGA